MRRYASVSIVALLAVLAGHRASPARSVSQPSAAEAIKRVKAMPIAFEANVGQTDRAASFVARGEGYVVWATGDGPIVRIGQPRSDRQATVRLRVVGGADTGHPAAESLLAGRANYFIGNDPSRWKRDVPRYGALRYSGVYKGIDLVLHGTQESLEYDFDVAPHADPSQIGVSFEGATAMQLEADGDLTLSVDGGVLSFRPPVAFQERNGARVSVPARYEIAAGNVVRFALGDYDPSRPLVIDPVLSYSTYLGGATTGSAERAWAVAVDGSGHAYVAGFTNAIDFPLTAGAWDSTCGGCTNSGGDAWVAKIDPSQSGAASLVFSSYLGALSTGSGTGSSTAYGVAVDGFGNVYVTGSTSGFNNPNTPANEAFPTTANALQPNDPDGLGFLDAFLTKLDPTGSTLLYSTYLGGNNVDEASAVKVDDAGHAYVAGWAASTNFGALLNGFRMTNPIAGFDGFVVKIDTTLSGAASLKYGTLVGGHSQDRIGGLALDAAGRVYVTGFTQSAAPEPFPVKNGFQMLSLGGQDGFMSVVDPAATGAASLLYSTLISSDGTENGALGDGGIAVDSNGIVYVAGTTSGGIVGFQVTPGAYKSVVQQSDAYVVKIDPSQTGASSLLASTLVGGIGQESGTALAIDAQDNPILAGWTISPDFGVTGCALPKLNGVDGFVTILDPSLSGLKYSSPLGGSGTDHVNDVAVGPSGLIYAAGYTESTNFPTTPVDSATSTAAFDPTHQGGQDGFLSIIAAALDACPVAPAAANLSTNTPEDTPRPLTLAATDAGGNGAPPETLTWTVVTGPSHGMLDQTSGVMTHGFGSAYTVNVIYTPASNYAGSDSFTFRVNDGTADSNLATVSISVSPVNDAPTANPQGVTTAEEVPILITLTGSDPENQFLTYSIGLQPLNGILSGSGASRTYSPSMNFTGQDSFTFVVTDSSGLASAPATVTITVTNVNDSPAAVPDVAATDDNTLIIVAVLANDVDPDGNALLLDSAGGCQHGTLTANLDGTVTYAPQQGFSGTDVCTYTVIDGQGGVATGQLTVAVTAINEPPSLASPGDQQTEEGTAVSLQLTASDPDSDTLTFAASGLPSGLSIDPQTGVITGTPAAGSAGSYQVTLFVGDSVNEPVAVTIVWVVTAPTAVNLPPVCSAAQPSVPVLWPLDHSLVPIQILGVSDPDGTQPAIVITQILQDEPTNTFGDGHTWIDGFGVGTATAQIRAERAASPKVPGDGRIYEIFFTATDAQGAACSGSVTVSVPRNQSGDAAIDSGVRYDSTVPGGQPLAKKF